MEYVPRDEDKLQEFIARMAKIEMLNNRYKGKKVVFGCSSFDLIHPGHVSYLKDAKEQGDVLIVGIQSDPTLDRKEKNYPIQSYEGRLYMLSSIKYVDEVIKYSTESDLYEILKALRIDVRVLGDDWRGKRFTGDDLPIKIYFHDRDYTWSSSGLRRLIYEKEKEKLEKN